MIAVIYGLIQGLTEFLPVSSSGHLALLPHFLDFKDPGVFFDLAMHLGTALSITLYFYRDILALLKQVLDFIKNPKEVNKSAHSLNMIIATITTVFFIFLLKGFSEQFGREPKIMAINLALFGIIMLVADKAFKDIETGQMQLLQKKKSFLIGMFQAMAVFPGVSRSGATLTISRVLGLGREEASRFSFLLSLPIIFAGFIYKLPKAMGENLDISSCLLGIAISFLTGLVTIHFFLKFIKKMGLFAFGIYRIILGSVLFFN